MEQFYSMFKLSLEIIFGLYSSSIYTGEIAFEIYEYFR